MYYFIKFFGMKLYMFRTVPLYIIRGFSLYTQHWYMSYRFSDSLRDVRKLKLIGLIVSFYTNGQRSLTLEF